MSANNDLISRSALMGRFEKFKGANIWPNESEILDWVIAMVDVSPAVDAVSPGVVEQFKWERDTAIAQLAELGIGLGEKMPEMQVVRHGRWILYDVREYAYGICIPEYKCSECGRIEVVKEPYCNCGAKMDAEENKRDA